MGNTIGINARMRNANSFMLRGDYDRAIAAFQSVAKDQRKLDDDQGRAFTYLMLGNLYRKKRNYEKAMSYHYKSLVLSDKLDNHDGINEVKKAIDYVFHYYQPKDQSKVDNVRVKLLRAISRIENAETSNGNETKSDSSCSDPNDSYLSQNFEEVYMRNFYSTSSSSRKDVESSSSADSVACIGEVIKNPEVALVNEESDVTNRASNQMTQIPTKESLQPNPIYKGEEPSKVHATVQDEESQKSYITCSSRSNSHESMALMWSFDLHTVLDTMTDMHDNPNFQIEAFKVLKERALYDIDAFVSSGATLNIIDAIDEHIYNKDVVTNAFSAVESASYYSDEVKDTFFNYDGLEMIKNTIEMYNKNEDVLKAMCTFLVNACDSENRSDMVAEKGLLFDLVKLASSTKLSTPIKETVLLALSVISKHSPLALQKLDLMTAEQSFNA